jgi:hypothetical protein
VTEACRRSLLPPLAAAACRLHDLAAVALQSLTCPPPIRRRARVEPPDYDLQHEAVALFEAGDHRKALARTLEHLFPGKTVPDLDEAPFVFEQGSSRVTVSLNDDELSVVVPVVRLGPDSIRTAALRYLLSDVSRTGQLYQPCLRGDEVFIEFRDRLPRLHPHKVKEVLRQMPFEADANDDWIAVEFKCEPLERQPVEALSDDEWERAQLLWQTHWTEVDELMKESQRKRSSFFFNEVTAYAVHHLQQAVPLNGYWWSRLSSAAETFNDTSIDASARERALAKCIKEMRAVGPESLKKSLGHATYAISPVADGSEQVLSTNLGPGDYVDTIMRFFNAGRYMESAVALIGTYCFLLARFSWPPAMEKMLLEGLAIGTDTPWREAASALLEHGRAMLAALEEDEDDEADDEDETEAGAEDEVEEGQES